MEAREMATCVNGNKKWEAAQEMGTRNRARGFGDKKHEHPGNIRRLWNIVSRH